jgi:hypothetical protein
MVASMACVVARMLQSYAPKIKRLAAIIATAAIIVVKKTGQLIAVKTMLRVLANPITKSQI